MCAFHVPGQESVRGVRNDGSGRLHVSRFIVGVVCFRPFFGIMFMSGFINRHCTLSALTALLIHTAVVCCIRITLHSHLRPLCCICTTLHSLIRPHVTSHSLATERGLADIFYQPFTHGLTRDELALVLKRRLRSHGKALAARVTRTTHGDHID